MPSLSQAQELGQTGYAPDYFARAFAVVYIPALSAVQNELEMLPQEIGLIQFVF